MSEVIALTVYWPLSLVARLIEALGMAADGLPLYYYSRRSFDAMRTDALDRFGTRVKSALHDRNFGDDAFRLIEGHRLQ